ncbi:DnaB-like replicative helicase [Bacillus phage PBC4]|uniref:Putative DNA helicase n=1 Tax=Bacillus phage PBC4 TaxID=1675028 RepID=A0A1D6X893_9CAUD|nr:DnaB-like replicative helicase [Bacillus phage PBC4]AKQ08235.1 putative DNA helicase [Bacillus phage PBC4]
MAELHSKSTEFYILKVMYNREAMIPEIAQKLKPNDFVDHNNRVMFGAMLRASASGGISAEGIMTLLEAERKQEHQNFMAAGGAYMIDSTFRDNTLPETPSIEAQVKMLKSYTYRRNAIVTANKVIAYAETNYDAEAGQEFIDVQAIDERIKENIYALRSNLDNDEEVKIIGSKVKRVREAIKNKEAAGISIAEKYPLLNQMFKALRPAALYVIGAPEKVGKSSFMLDIAMFLVTQYGIPVAYADTEMTEEEILLRMVSKISGVPEDLISNDTLNEHQTPLVERAWDIAEELPLYYFNANMMDNSKLESKVKELQLKHNIQLFVYDYVKIQSHEIDSGRTDLIMAAKIDTLKEKIAKQCKIPIITSGQAKLDEHTKKWRFWETSHFGKLADVICFLYKVDPSDAMRYGTHELVLTTGRKVDQKLIGKAIAFEFQQNIHSVKELGWVDGKAKGV